MDSGAVRNQQVRAMNLVDGIGLRMDLRAFGTLLVGNYLEKKRIL